MLLTQKAVFLFALFFLFPGQAHAQVRLGSEEATKLVIQAPLPLYPEIARIAHVRGLVKVEAIVSEQGIVTSARVISGHPLLQNAALIAVKGSKYKPHTIADKAVAFITIVDLVFPPGTLSKDEKQEYERDSELADQYFKSMKICRGLMKEEDWKEAEKTCAAVVTFAEKLSDDRAMEKMSANETLGHVFVRQRRFPEAIDYYQRAMKMAGNKLTESDAELGQLYGDLAIAHHLMRDLDKAREFYRKAEAVYQLAYRSIGNGDSDEWVTTMKQEYLKSLRTLIEYHLTAAQDAGAIAEEAEIKKLRESLPSKE
jgi:TonB family protein